MALPDTDRFRQPTLQALSGGIPVTSDDVHPRVQAILGASDVDRAYVPPKSHVSPFTNRVAWAFVDLQRRKLIEKTRDKPNTYKITDAGERALAEGLDLSAVSPRGGSPSARPDPPPLRARAFDPDRPPKPSDFREPNVSPEAKQQLLEKARQGHHRILVDLVRWLTARSWTSIGEIPGSVDLWATSPRGQRWIFEAKTIRDSNQLSQTRAALAQLLEYRLVYGGDDDNLCIVLDHPLSSARSDLLGRLGIAVIRARDESVECLNAPAEEIA